MIRWFAIAALFCAGAAAVDFRNVAREAGLTVSIPNGGAQSKKYIIETTGSGAAFFDYDNDGLLDIFLVSGPGGSNRRRHVVVPRPRLDNCRSKPIYLGTNVQNIPGENPPCR